jgi:thiamine biosynthesis lipoprotein
VTTWRHAEPVMGTVFTFDVRTAGPAEDPRETIARATSWLHWVDATFSTYRADSEICRLDRGEIGEADCNMAVQAILAMGREFGTATGGYFDVRASGRLDPSGVVKGWAIERASAMLAEAGWADHCVNGGGDASLRGEVEPGRAWQVGITHPWALDAFCAVVAVTDGAVATSGTYERGFHVLDPHRGRPATDLAAVTVVGPSIVLADAYATAALAMGNAAPEWLAQQRDYESFLIDSAGRGWSTPGFSSFRLDP